LRLRFHFGASFAWGRSHAPDGVRMAHGYLLPWAGRDKTFGIMYCFHPRCLKPFAFQFLVLAMSLTSTMTLAQPLTVDASGRESAYSNEAPAVIPSP
jgi:hypothetical protein